MTFVPFGWKRKSESLLTPLNPPTLDAAEEALAAQVTSGAIPLPSSVVTSSALAAEVAKIKASLAALEGLNTTTSFAELLTLPRGAATKIEEDPVCDYYVDSVGGNDANAGTKALPFKTLAHAKTVIAALGEPKNKRVGLKRGSVFREEAKIEFFASTKWEGLILCAYGSGATPIVTGGKLVTGWTILPPVGSNVEPGSGAQVLSKGLADAFQFTAARSETVERIKMQMAAAEVNTATSVKFAILSDSANTPGAVLAEGTFTGVPGTGALIEATIAATALTAGTKYWLAFMPLGGNLHYKQTTGPAGLNYKATAEAATITASAFPTKEEHGPAQIYATRAAEVGLYYATLNPAAPSAKTSAVKVTTGTEVSLYASGQLAASVSAMTATSWFYSETEKRLYLWLPSGASPSGSTVDAACWNPLEFNSPKYPALEGIELQLGPDLTLSLHNAASNSVLRNVTTRYTGFSANPGSLSILGSSNVKVLGYTAVAIDNDGLLISHSGGVGSSYVEVANFAIEAINGVQSDGIQVEDKTGQECNHIWIHDGYIWMVGTNSPKSCITCATAVEGGVTRGTGSKIERVECLGGHGGISIGQNNILVSHAVCLENNSASFAGNLYMGQPSNIENITVEYLLGGEGRQSVNLPGGYLKKGEPEGGGTGETYKRTGLLFNHCTLAYPEVSVWKSTNEDEPGGKIKNSILWGPTCSGAIIVLPKVAPEKLLFENCIIGPERAGKNLIEYEGTGYETLAAFVAAHPGIFINCKSSTAGGAADPLFQNPHAKAYALSSGSPALAAATDGGNIGAF